ncbi:hypothetical protein [Halosimplex pelagicum]|uniref:Uncharacterized protein n=1 Tax=Halosimplex pelagicum TaxID=869886 RepID=A0A7D5TBU2_9EURY|nr:hypothetical protein [Halosimplex pelagicum]QLH82473.1 hypothetical protein HZS54_12985 [Halosimplex pelagicum]QLH82529.1 hypothetical protein HZS54_13290 [Halosimplex pelagicum]
MSVERVRIEHECDGQEVVGFGAYRVLETFDDAASEGVREDVRNRVARAMEDFPELAHEVVTVVRLDPDFEPDDVNGRAGMSNRLVYLPAEERSWMMTVYHELAHLAIHIRDTKGDDVPPTSEEYCSIFAVARMPPELIERNYISYLGEPGPPQEEWPEICRRALAYREENGANSHYIQRAREWLGVDE